MTNSNIPVPPDDNPPEVPFEYDTVLGELASRLVHDYKLIQHEHGLNGQEAANWMQFANVILQMNDGPLYVDVEESEDDL